MIDLSSSRAGPNHDKCVCKILNTNKAKHSGNIHSNKVILFQTELVRCTEALYRTREENVVATF